MNDEKNILATESEKTDFGKKITKKENAVSENFDLNKISAVTMEDIKNQIKVLQIMCQHMKVPMFCSIVEKDSVLGTKYYSEAVTPQALGLYLRKDYISPMLLVLNGFSVVNTEPVEILM